MAFRVLGVAGVTGVASAAYLMHSKSEGVWNNVNMPIIRTLDAEKAHRLSVRLAGVGWVPSFKTLDEDKNLLVRKRKFCLYVDFFFFYASVYPH